MCTKHFIIRIIFLKVLSLLWLLWLISLMVFLFLSSIRGISHIKIDGIMWNTFGYPNILFVMLSLSEIKFHYLKIKFYLVKSVCSKWLLFQIYVKLAIIVCWKFVRGNLLFLRVHVRKFRYLWQKLIYGLELIIKTALLKARKFQVSSLVISSFT